jgi:hypothetical protein
VPFKAVMDRAAEIAVRHEGQPDHPDAAIDPARLAREQAASASVAVPRIVLTDVST